MFRCFQNRVDPTIVGESALLRPLILGLTGGSEILGVGFWILGLDFGFGSLDSLGGSRAHL